MRVLNSHVILALLSVSFVGSTAAFTLSRPAISTFTQKPWSAVTEPSPFRSTPTPTQLHESTGSGLETAPEADYDALLKYHAAIAIQMGLICGIFKGLDIGVDLVGIQDIPAWGLFPIFFALSLKSRTLNPLDNQRPNIKKAVEGEQSRGFGDRAMPSWTPPGPVFPIMWVLIIGPIRAYSSALVWEANGHHFFDPAILALMFHLAVGDVWNTMNNSEQRFGASVTGVLCVTASALNAAYQYYTVDEFAGNLLGLPMIWFAVAASLITATWKINPDPTTGELEPLYPTVREQKTTFAWFSGSDSE